MISISNGYKYSAHALLHKDGDATIRLGCFTRSRKEWEENFWNNDREFPNDGSEGSEMRLFLFNMICLWTDKKWKIFNSCDEDGNKET